MLHFREERMAPHFAKFHIDGLPAAAVLHHFTEPDHGDFHNHPWPFTSTILFGGYVEEILDTATGAIHIEEHEPGETFRIEADHTHRIISLPQGECWTLIMPGEHVQKSGFYRVDHGQVMRRHWDESEFKPVVSERSMTGILSTMTASQLEAAMAYDGPIDVGVMPPATDMVETAIKGVWGERCPDYAEHCPVCQAWGQFDALSTP